MPQPKPEWMRARMASSENYKELQETMRSLKLHTVCEEAQCPNLFECWSKRTATFMILGRICTRACRFCAVQTGLPSELDLEEPKHVAEAVKKMGLHYVVITSVARDDLADGGASIFAQTIQEIRHAIPACKVEVLIPDFNGSEASLALVLQAEPNVLNHNIESVKERSNAIRARANYEQSLRLLKMSKELNPHIPTKSSIMVGIGETWQQLLVAMDDLRGVGCDIMTIGQYLQPSSKHAALDRYYTPDEFSMLKQEGLTRGFSHVESGPLVRSSYHSMEQWQNAKSHLG